MNVEALAVNSLGATLGRCPLLSPLIDHNDRTPFTDGHIDVYSQPRHSNESWSGRVTVQVKGRTRDRSTKKALSYHRISQTELRAYLGMSGVLYFVVSLDSAGRSVCTHYSVLDPFYIERLLANADGTKKVRVPLKLLPAEPEKIQSLVQYCLQTRLQNPQMGFDLSLLEQAEEFTVYAPTPLDLGPAPLELRREDREFSIHVRTAGGAVLPMNVDVKIIPSEYMERSLGIAVECGDVVYDNPVARRVDPDTIEIELSQGVLLRLAGARGEFKFRMAESLYERHKDLTFYMAVSEGGVVRINGSLIEYGTPPSGPSDELQRHWVDLDQLSRLFATLGADTSPILIEDLHDDEVRVLGRLCAVFLDGRELPRDMIKSSGRVRQSVAGWTLDLLCMPGENGWKCFDTFALDNRSFWFQDSDKDYPPIPVTPYYILSPDELAVTLNLHLDRVVAEHVAISAHKDVAKIANHTVLTLIQAGDIQESRRAEFLSASRSLNEWLTEREPGSDIHLMNRLQIERRERPLTGEERSQVWEVKRRAIAGQSEDPQMTEVSCALLLGAGDEVDYLVQGLPAAKRDQLKKWPIWALKDLLANGE